MQEAYGGFAALYDPLMQDVDYDGWAGYLASFLPPSGMIVDCACGTGAITIRLARKGFSMIGVDISPEMLEQAASKARKAGLRIPFVCQDMARLQLHRPCQGIVCACDGVNYLDNLEDVEAFFSAAHRGLCPGGWLLFDVSSAYKLETILGNNTFAQAEADCAYIFGTMPSMGKAGCWRCGSPFSSGKGMADTGDLPNATSSGPTPRRN